MSPKPINGSRPQKLAVAGLFLILASAGATVTATEFRAYFSLRGEAPLVALLRETEAIQGGLSYYGKDEKISGCFSALEALNRPIYSERARRRGAEVCLRTAQEVLRSAQTFAAAHQLLAEAHFQLGEPDLAVAALQDAALLAPNTLWLLQRRFMLLSRLARPVPGVQADELVAKLISVPQGRSWLAGVYLSDAAVRRLVEEGAGALPAEDSRRFLAEVKSASRAAAGQGEGQKP